MRSLEEDEVYHCAIIDVLIRFNVKKQLESEYKTRLHGAEAVSVVPPDQYAARLHNFLSQNMN